MKRWEPGRTLARSRALRSRKDKELEDSESFGES